ncbi:MAG TPA: HAD-IIIA family hydrolase [Candidatus Binataceae bacterium]|nr:HAD-IIIA family hydrolase [Candidatus Binataceae bacterium]
MTANAGKAAIFCDLVGTLVRMDDTRQLPLDARGSVIVELLPGVAEKLGPLHDHLIFVVSNQAGIKRGRLTRERVEAAMAELDRKLGGILGAWKICPHDDADKCGCRKPKGGMILELARDHGVDLKASLMVGDQEIDEQAARAAGLGRFVYAKDFFGWK